MQVDDQTEAQDAQHITLNPIPTVIPTNERKEYRVTSEVPLFKNGELYEKGDTVELNVHNAKAFMELGEVEELTDEN